MRTSSIAHILSKRRIQKSTWYLFLLLTFTWCTYLLTLARGTFLPFNQTSSWRVRYRLSKMEVTLKSQRMEAPLNCRKQPSHYQTVSPAGRCTATCNPFPRLKYPPRVHRAFTWIGTRTFRLAECNLFLYIINFKEYFLTPKAPSLIPHHSSIYNIYVSLPPAPTNPQPFPSPNFGISCLTCSWLCCHAVCLLCLYLYLCISLSQWLCHFRRDGTRWRTKPQRVSCGTEA